MKNKSKKIAELLQRSNNFRAEAMASKEADKREKLLAKSEASANKAYALALNDVSVGVNSGFGDIFAADHAMASVLFVSGRYEEARRYLEDAKRVPDFGSQKYSLAVNALYGCVLCIAEEYDASAELFVDILNRTEDENSREAAYAEDTYAMIRAYGHMGIAFAYTETKISDEQFEEPLIRLDGLKQKGMDVGDCIKTAAYYVAANCTFRINNNDVITQGNVEPIIKSAELCMSYCKPHGDFFMAAAMKLKAFAIARDLRFSDCAQYCPEVLEYCERYKDMLPKNPYGDLHDIAADINILMGILHYRVGLHEQAVEYFTKAIEELKSMAAGKKLGSVGYVELESVIMRVTAAEKAAFACEYLGLSMLEQKNKYSIEQSMDVLKQSAEYWASISSEPYFYMRATAVYDMMSRICEEAQMKDLAGQYAEDSKRYGVVALTELKKLSSNEDEYKKCTKRLCSRRQLAMSRGCLELNADYIMCERMMNEEPYVKPNVVFMADINFQLAEYKKISGSPKSAISYYDCTRKYTHSKDGVLRPEFVKSLLPEWAMRSKAECLVKIGEMKQAHEAFAQYIELYRNTSASMDADEYANIARSAKSVGLNNAKIAEYYRMAALKSRDEGSDSFRTARLFNNEGTFWYNSSPENDDFFDMSPEEKFEGDRERMHRLAAMFRFNESSAFENAYNEIKKCDQSKVDVMEFLPPLLSNLAECYTRVGNDRGMELYNEAVDASERFFATEQFKGLNESAKGERLRDYAMCLKSIAEIYSNKEEHEKAIEYFTRAINAFEKINDDGARYQLSYCLNARGCLNYRLGNYQNEINDITQAIALRSQDEGNELTLAIMYKNRAEAYEEAGNNKMNYNDLCNSIEMLDRSEAPREILLPLYGEHLFALGVCEENLDMDGKAADSYQKALMHYEAMEESGEQEIDMKAVCHFRRAGCRCRRDEREYYGALSDYNDAIKLLEQLPPSKEKDERLGAVLSARAALYEVFCQLDLAQTDIKRAKNLLGKDKASQ